MKFSALIAAVSANWNGVSDTNTCGMQISGDSMVNSTCTISGLNIAHKFAGNGAFITSENTFTGFDGISGNSDVVVFFEQTCTDGDCDNSTCWDAAVSCVDNGAETAGVFFMETVNLQISGVSSGDTLMIDLAGFACQNISAPFGEVFASQDAWGSQYSDDGIFSVTVGDGPFGDLFQISVTQQPGQTESLNLWEASVSN